MHVYVPINDPTSYLNDNLIARGSRISIENKNISMKYSQTL